MDGESLQVGHQAPPSLYTMCQCVSIIVRPYPTALPFQGFPLEEAKKLPCGMCKDMTVVELSRQTLFHFE